MTLADVKLTPEWCLSEASVCDEEGMPQTATALRLAARALRYAEAQRSYTEAMLRHDPCDADPPRHSPCMCNHCRDYKATWPPMNQAKDALLTYAWEVTP